MKKAAQRTPKKFAAVLITLLAVISAGAPAAFADSDYYLTDNSLYLQFSPQSYYVDKVSLSVGNEEDSLDNPEDIFIDFNDNVFIADTSNNRVLKFDSDMNLLQTIPNPEDGGSKAALSSPQGVFVSKIGDYFVADTGNRRVVHYDADGRYVEEFLQPSDPTFDTDTGYKPTKVFVDDYGILYIISAQDYHGIITMDAKGAFLGYIGAVKNGFDVGSYLVRIFASQSQQDQLQKDVPPYYSNMTTNGDGTIYATTMFEDSYQIKRLTQAGNNVYEAKFFGESNQQRIFNFLPAFADLAVNREGIVFAADSVSNMIYVYDQSGNSLAVFGGEGLYKKKFASVSSLAVNSKNQLYVLDRATGAVQILNPTGFMENVFSAITLYNNGDYEKAIEPWNQVISMNLTYRPAQIGLAKSLLRNGDAAGSLQMYKSALDQEGYSEAFEQIRSDFFRSHFLLVAGLLIASVCLLIFALSRLHRHAGVVADRELPANDRIGAKFFGQTVLLMLFHPIDGFNNIKRNRENIRWWTIGALLAALAAVQILFWRLIHFPLSPQIIFVSYPREIIVFFVPLISWILVGYAMTSISDGKQTFKESMAANLYSLVPYILFYLPVTALTNVMSRSDSGIYTGLVMFLYAWCAALLFTNLKIMNEYVFKTALLNVFKIIFAVLCCWLIVFMLYIVVSQLFTFSADIIKEATFISK